MLKLVKSAERKEIFELENGVKRWIENWDTFLYLKYTSVEKDVDKVNFEELKAYPIGDTKKVTTVTQIVKGKDPDELFYPDKPAAPVRKITVLGTVLTGCEHLAIEIGCKYIIGNGWYWGDYDLFESLGGKSIINLKPKPTRVPTKKEIEERMKLWIDRPGCGGWWIDNGIRGEEPDGQPQSKVEAKKMLKDRQWFYKTVRAYDPDSINRPVFEQFNMTEQGVVAGAWRSGWKGQYREAPMTCDVNLWTCYTSDYEEQLKWFKVFPLKYMTGKVQLIPQVSVEHFKVYPNGDDSIAEAYRNWKKIMADHGLQIGGLAYYSWLLIKDNVEAQNAIREVNKLIK